MTRHSFNNPQFYLTAPQPCPYLPEQQERKIFTYLVGEDADMLNDSLSSGGFRRSQTIAYRPACEACQACLSVRVVVPLYHFSKNQRRILRKNDDLIAQIGGPIATMEQYALFRDYLEARHDDGGMSAMSMGDFGAMVEDSHVDTQVIEYRLRQSGSGISGKGGELIGVALTDQLSDACSMVYSFFRPDMTERSLGTFIILDHIRRAIEEGWSHVYLGYWVKGSAKMNYKTRFQPMEFLGPYGWEMMKD
ncbi:MAG: arginyltransferase [Cohaesibacter sp.]|nr:arginyltransferase [Cohaesibacter sp.]MCV6600602.1 arginyltransferase [Cohaesibacter sp.]